MEWKRAEFEVHTHGKGVYSINALIENQLRALGVTGGMCFLFIPHTSASLIISESFDPTARADLEKYLDINVPENQSWHAHTLEGPDDSPSHIRAMLTQTSLSIPVEEGRLLMGTWQGVFLFEHRADSHRRRIVLRALSVV